MNDPVFLVLGAKTWNRRVFDDVLRKLPGDWHYLIDRADFTAARVQQLRPRYVFFLHWSWKVPEEIISEFECICFHMTDVPYGRGGSPLQNLIARGHRETKLTALRMTAEFDAGPVYLKRPLSLEGAAEEILMRSSDLAGEMIATIISEQLQPIPQHGAPTLFKRRRPEESAIPKLVTTEKLHDFIRMLDAEGYPKAFLQHEGFHYEFTRAVRYNGRIVADVTITPVNEKIP